MADPQVGTIAVGVDQSYLSRSVSAAILQGVRTAQIGNRGLKFNIDERSFRQPLGRITGDVNKFESALAAANQRVITFGASAGIILGVVRGFQELIKSTIEVEKAFTDINSVFQLSSQNLNKFSRDLFDVARQTSQAFNVAAEAAVEFSRQGLSAEETLKRVKDALVLTRLSGLDAATAVSTLTAAVNGFSRAGLNTTEIVNKLATVDAAFAVSSKDLAEALSRVGSTAQDAGVGFDELIGLVTSAQQTTARGGAVIGNALKSIFTRIERRGTLDSLEDLGIEIRDIQDNVKPAIEILKTLAKTYDGLGRAQQQQVAELSAGVFQINQFKAILSDLSKENSIFALATQTSSRAVDEATKRNEALNTTLSALLQNFATTSKQIGSNFGQAIIAPLFRDIQSILGKGGLFNPLVESFKNIDTTDMGISFGEGILRGLGRVFGTESGVPGPGLIAITAAFTKILSSTAVLAFKDLRSLFNAGNINRDLSIQKGIETTLNAASEAERRRFFAAKSNADQQRIILELLNRQVVASTQLAASNALFVRGLRTADPTLAKALTIVGAPRAAGGIIPAMAQEKHAVSRGVGGASAGANPVLIPNFNFGRGKKGPVVANTDEYIVPNYAGTNASAIFNPAMVKAYGLPKGARKITAAEGIVPNFARFYHGTSRRKIFENESGFKNSSRGVFLTTDQRMAGAYAMNFENQIEDYNRGLALNKTRNTRGRIIPINIDFKNTYKLTPEEQNQYFIAHERGDPVAFQKSITKRARAKGYDSINYGNNEYTYIDNPKNLIPGFSEGLVPNFARAGSARAIGQQAVLNSGGRIDSGRFSIPVTRRQKYAQAGNESVRGGVFYLPSSEKPSRFGYSNPATLYGGPQRISGQREFSSPFFVRAATGGAGPERAYSEAFGRKALKSLQDDVRNIVVSRALGPEYLQKIDGFIAKYAPEKASGNFASYLLNSSRQGNQLKYALQELAIGSAIKRRGNDAILSYGFQRGTKAPKLREVFALNEHKYPTSALGLIPNFSLNSRRRTLSEAIKSPERIRKYTGTFDENFRHENLDFLPDLGDISLGDFLGDGAFKRAFSLGAFKNINRITRSISPLSTVALQSSGYNDKEFINDIYKLDQFSRIGAPVPKVFGRGKEGMYGPDSALVERVRQIDGYSHDLAGSTTRERNLSSNILNHILPFLSGFKTPSSFPGALGDIRAANLGISYRGDEKLVIEMLKELSKYKGLNPGLTKSAFDRGLKIIDVGYLQPKIGAKGIVPNFAAPFRPQNFDVNRGQRYENLSAFYLNTIQNKVARESFSEELKKRVLSRQSPMFDTHALPNYLRGKGYPESVIQQMLERYERNRNFSNVRVDAVRGYTGTDIPTLAEINFSDIFEGSRYGFGMNPAEERFSYNALQGRRKLDRARIFAARNYQNESGRGFISPFGPEPFLQPGRSLRLLDNTFTKIPMLGRAGGLVPNFKNEFFRGVRGAYSPFSFVGSPGTIFAARDKSIAKEYTRDANDYDNYHGSIGQFSIRKGTKIFNAVGRVGKQRFLKEILEPLGPDYARLLRNGGSKVFNLLDYSSVKQSLINKGYKGVHLDEYDRDAGYEYVGKSIALFDPKAIENQRIVDTLAKGTIPNTLTRSDERIPRYASGFDPMALRQSLHREISAGVPPSQVYIDRDPRLKGPANPAGLLVANRRDEPLGGFQGINRVIKQGGNPKFAGANIMSGGHVPNFVDSVDKILTDRILQQAKELGVEGLSRNDILLAIGKKRGLTRAKTLTGPAKLKILSALLGEAESIQKSQVSLESQRPTDPIARSNLLKTLGSGSKPSTGLGLDPLPKTGGFGEKGAREAEKRAQEFAARAKPQYDAIAKRTIQLNQEAFQESIRQNLSRGVPLSQRTIGKLRKNAKATIIERETLEGGAFEGLTEKEVRSRIKTDRRAAALVNRLTESAVSPYVSKNRDILAERAAQKAQENRLKRDETIQRVARNQGVFSTASGGLSQVRQAFGIPANQPLSPRDIQSFKELREQRRGQLSAKFSNAALGASFIAPLLGGFIPQGRGGTSAGQFGGAASGALQGASSGAVIGSFGGPLGIAIGAAIGGIGGGVAGFISKSKKSFDELARQIEDANSKNAQSINAASQFGQIQQAISDTIQSGDFKQLDRLIKNQVDTLKNVSNNEDRQKLISAKSGEEFSEILANIIRRSDLEARGRDVLSSGFRLKEERGFFSGFTGDDVASFSESISKAANFTEESLSEFSRAVDRSGSQALVAFAKNLNISQEEARELISKIGDEGFIKGSLRLAIDNIGKSLRDSSLFENIQKRRVDLEVSFRNQFKELSESIKRASFERSSIEDFKINSTASISQARINSNPFSSDLSKLQKNNAQLLNNLILSNQNTFKTTVESVLSDFASVIQKEQGVLGKSGLSQIVNSIFQEFRSTGDRRVLETLSENKNLPESIRELLAESITSLKKIEISSDLSQKQLVITNRLNELSYREQLRQETIANVRFDPDILEKVFKFRAQAEGAGNFAPNARAEKLSARIGILDAIESAGLRPGEQTKKLREQLQTQLGDAQAVNIGQAILSDFVGAQALTIKDIDTIKSILGDIVSGKKSFPLTRTPNEERLQIARAFLESNKETDTIKSFNFEEELSRFFGEQRETASSDLFKRGIISFGDSLITGQVETLKGPIDNVSKTILDKTNPILLNIENAIKTSRSIEAEQKVVQEISELKARRLALSNEGVSLGGSKVNRDKLENLFNSKSRDSILKEIAKRTNSFSPGYGPVVRDELGSILSKPQDVEKITPEIKKLTDAIRQQLSIPENTLDAGTIFESLTNRSLRGSAAQAGFSQTEYDKFVISLIRKVSPEVDGVIQENTRQIKELDNSIIKLEASLSLFNFKDSSTRKPGTSKKPLSTIDELRQTFGSSTNFAAPELSDINPYDEMVRRFTQAKSPSETAIDNRSNPSAQTQDLIDAENNVIFLRKALEKARKNEDNFDPKTLYDKIVSAEIALNEAAGELAQLKGDRIGSFKTGMNDVFLEYKKNLFDMRDIGRNVASSIESNFTDSFTSFINGTQSAGDAFRNFAASVLSDASRMFAQKAIQSLLGQFSFANASTNNLGGYVPKFANGGMVPALLTGGEYVFSPKAARSLGPSLLKRINAGAATGFAGGGMVYGGSGVRDDVPAMVPSGSFVIRKSAVQKYGGGYLSSLANNRVQKRFWGGALLGALIGGVTGYATGGKKGALIGAGLGFVGGGLSQNFAQTGSAFKSGGSGSGFFSFARQTPNMLGTAGAGGLPQGYIESFGGPSSLHTANAGNVAGFGGGLGKQATLSAALKQSLVGFGASAALGLIAKALGPKANKPWADKDITPNRLAMERAQQSSIDAARGNGNIVMLEQNPQGGFSLVGYGQTPATRRFAEGGMVMAQNEGMRPYAEGGYVGGGTAMAIAPDGAPPASNISINIEINDNRTSATASTSDDSEDNKEFSKRLSDLIRAETAQYINEQQRVGGSLRNTRR